jgi:hypothetical protein
MTMVPERTVLHRLVDMLPESDLDAAQRVLRGLLAADRDPILAALLSAPEDDEAVTEEDIAAEAQANADIAASRIYSHEQARKILLGDK